MNAQLLFAMGVALIALSAVAAIAVAIILLIRHRHIRDQLEREYGPQGS